MGIIHFDRVRSIRELMASRGWDVVVIRGTDPHSSEYPAPRWKQVEWISGFTGEAGDLAITADHAGLWTDSRYFIQSSVQLQGSGIELHKTRQSDSVPIWQWIKDKFEGRKHPVIAIDGLCNSSEDVGLLSRAGTVVDVPDLPGLIWEDRPPVPITPIQTLSDSQAGESRQDRISGLRKFLLSNGCDAILLSSLDEIAWVLNVRGSDIEYNPLVISYLLVTMDRVDWFVTKDTVPEDPDTIDSFEELEADQVNILPYSAVTQLQNNQETLFVDPSSLNHTVGRALEEAFADIIYGTSPIPLAKAVKNQVEIDGFREAYFADGIAVEKFLFWLENEVKIREVDEWEASLKMTGLRAEIPGYRGNSFENISAYGKNAALPHYSTPARSSAVIRPMGLYLTDSGGQYIFGTTDITRTVPLGPCTELEKEDYTLVLKGMIDLSLAVFPAGTAGCQIDALARAPLWKNFRNFGHGTGHGTGFWLCVHEGPQDIRQNFNSQPLLPGMVISNEPGLYREGLHGVRHENIILCKELETNGFGRWYGFETLTLCHIDTAAVIKELLTEEELLWLNNYNEHVYSTLGPELDEEMRIWLRNKTLPL